MLLYNYADAIGCLQKALKKGDTATVREATLLMAECYRMLNDVDGSVTWYAKAVEGGMADPDARFHYAQALRSSGRYEAAKKEFLSWGEAASARQRAAEYAALCDSALAWLQKPATCEVRNLEALNSPQSEFGLVFYDSGILFTSDRFTRKDEPLYGWTGNPFLRLFYAERRARGKCCDCFSRPEPFDRLANPDGHNGPVCFDAGFKTAFVNRTLSASGKGRKEAGGIRTRLLQLYTSGSADGKWKKPEPFFLNSNDYSVGHPALSPDGGTLYFVSDRPGGYGGTDIWSCKKKNGKWDDPVNLGPAVNSPGDEMFPVITSPGILCFASDGLPGFGGLDLFIARFTDGAWQKPANAGHPLNSSFDDFAMIADPGDSTGFFSSNRPGGAGSDDLYCYRRLPPPPEPVLASADTIPKPPVPRPVLNKTFVLKNIYYDLDKWDIRDDARPPLDSLVRIMKAWPVTVELSSHTDCRASAAYNMTLSQKRAESAAAYLIRQGIEPVRIRPKGYGESKLVNGCDCTPPDLCTEAQHQENRRTEIRFISLEEQPAPQ
jgi:outer membrane protein OmpA-like peptidoglycan-associated protein